MKAWCNTVLPETMIIYNVLFISLGLVLGATLIAYEQRMLARRVRVLETTCKRLVRERNEFWSIVGKILESSDAEEVLRKLRRKRRRRYIVFYVIAEEREGISPEKLEKAVREAVERLYGLIGAGDAYPQLVFYDPREMAGIIRTTHTAKHIVIAGLASVRKIDGVRVVIVPIATTGTIKRAKRILATRRKGLEEMKG